MFSTVWQRPHSPPCRLRRTRRRSTLAAIPSGTAPSRFSLRSEQLTLAARVEAHDPPSFNLEGLRLVGGLDTSFFAAGDGEGESGRSVAALAVLSLPDLRLVHTQLLALEALPAPYRAGFLGFRRGRISVCVGGSVGGERCSFGMCLPGCERHLLCPSLPAPHALKQAGKCPPTWSCCAARLPQACAPSCSWSVAA